MADLSVTPADVRPLPGAVTRRYTTGGTCYVGNLVYGDSSGYVQQADANGSLTAIPRGIVVADNEGGTVAASGDRVDVVVFGPVAGFSSLTPGLQVYASATTGLMTTNPEDLGAGTYEGVVGWVDAADIIFVNPYLPSTLGTAKS